MGQKLDWTGLDLGWEVGYAVSGWLVSFLSALSIPSGWIGLLVGLSIYFGSARNPALVG